MRFRNMFNVSVLLAAMAAFGVVNSATAQSVKQNYTVIKILGVNDFHGQLTTLGNPDRRPQGGAAVLASYLKQAMHGYENNTVITFSGDQVGASIPVSGLLDHEPSILFLNTLANKFCLPANRMEAKCNMVATLGNHEFDKGHRAMFDLINGSDKQPKNNWIDLPAYPGASFPYVSANIVSEDSGKLMFPPYVIKNVGGVKVGFIGIITKNAASSMLPENAKGVKFLDEAQAINQFLPQVKSDGASVVIVMMHEGGDSKGYDGETRQNVQVNGEISHIVNNLDDGVDVVLAGHTHRFINAYLPDHHGHPVLVTESNSYSAAFSEVTLQIDNTTKAVASKSAKIVTTYADAGPGATPDASAQKIVKLAEDSVAPVVKKQIGSLSVNLHRSVNGAGESTLGNLVADAFKNIMHVDIALTNSSSIRADLKSGDVTWGDLYAVQPFANPIIKMKFTGQDILDLLEQQWKTNHGNKYILQVSGLEYSYDERKPVDHRVDDVKVNGKPLNLNQSYTVATTSFLASAGDGFSVMKRGEILEVGPTDLEILIAHIKSLQQPFTSKIEGRIHSNS